MKTPIIKLTAATIAKLDLEPGDVILIRITDPARRLTKEQAEVLREDARRILGADRQVLVLPYGIDLEKIELAVDDKALGETAVPA